MKHLILDPGCLFDSRYTNYRFHLATGSKTDFFKSSPDVPVNKDGTCKKNSFYVVQARKSGMWQIVPGQDKSQRCLVMMSANPQSECERIEIDTHETLAQILAVYDINSAINGLKIICIMTPRSPLMIKYTNTVTGSVRYEMSIYDALDEVVQTRSLSSSELTYLVGDTVLLHDVDLDLSLIKADPQNIDSWSPELVAKAENYYARYHSFLKDKILAK